MYSGGVHQRVSCAWKNMHNNLHVESAKKFRQKIGLFLLRRAGAAEMVSFALVTPLQGIKLKEWPGTPQNSILTFIGIDSNKVVKTVAQKL